MMCKTTDYFIELCAEEAQKSAMGRRHGAIITTPRGKILAKGT